MSSRSTGCPNDDSASIPWKEEERGASTRAAAAPSSEDGSGYASGRRSSWQGRNSSKLWPDTDPSPWRMELVLSLFCPEWTL